MTEHEEVDLDAEYERIVEEIDDVTDRLAEMDSTTDQYDVLDERATRLETHRRGVNWARGFPDNDDLEGSGWDVDSITIRPLSYGDDGRLDDHTSSSTERRLWQIAIGTVEAPYLRHDGVEYPDVSIDDIEKTVATIDREFRIAPGRWLQDRIDEVSTVGNLSAPDSYARSRAEKRAERASTRE